MAKIPANVERSARRFLNEVARQHRISAAYLYGSQARGAASVWSDIDVAIISPDFPADLFSEQLALMRIAAEIDDRIEPRAFTPGAFTVNDPLRYLPRLALDAGFPQRDPAWAGAIRERARPVKMASSSE